MFGGLFGGGKSEATKAKEKLAKVDPNSRNGRLIAEAKPLLAKKRSKLDPGDEDKYLVEISRALDSFAEDEKDTSLDAHRKRLRWELMVERIFLKISKMGEAHCGEDKREKQALYDLYDFKPKGAPPKPQPQQQTFTAAEAPPVVNLMPSSAPPPAQFQKPQKLQHGTKLYHASPKKISGVHPEDGAASGARAVRARRVHGLHARPGAQGGHLALRGGGTRNGLGVHEFRHLVHHREPENGPAPRGDAPGLVHDAALQGGDGAGAPHGARQADPGGGGRTGHVLEGPRETVKGSGLGRHQQSLRAHAQVVPSGEGCKGRNAHWLVR